MNILSLSLAGSQTLLAFVALLSLIVIHTLLVIILPKCVKSEEFERQFE